MANRGALGRWIVTAAHLGLWCSVVISSGFSSGCARQTTEDDCKELGAHLHELWSQEAKFPGTATPSAEKAVAVVKSEGKLLEDSFVTDCKRELLGKPRSSGELSCLAHAKTLADVHTCATIPAH